MFGGVGEKHGICESITSILYSGDKDCHTMSNWPQREK